MENRLTKEEFGVRQKLVVRIYANKVMTEGQISNLGEAVEKIRKMLETESNCYRIEVIKIKENYNIATGVATKFLEREALPMWVTNEITSAKKIKKNTPNAKFEPNITAENMNAPAIKKGIYIQHSMGPKTGMETAKQNPASTTIVWHELTVKDVVVNKDLKQIYPTATGKMPTLLIELLQHVR